MAWLLRNPESPSDFMKGLHSFVCNKRGICFQSSKDLNLFRIRLINYLAADLSMQNKHPQFFARGRHRGIFY